MKGINNFYKRSLTNEYGKQRLGKKAILIYFGGISDRVEQILSTGADALIMETSMKGYVNDFETIAEQINGRICLFGNIDPVGTVEKSYVTSAGSPLTPKTPVSRIRRFIDIAHGL